MMLIQAGQEQRQQERLLDRQQRRPDQYRALLHERRQQHEEEWRELEDVRDELESREQLLACLFHPAAVPLDLVQLTHFRTWRV